MANDTETTLTVLDGTGTPRLFYGTVNGGTTYVFQFTPRVNGAQVGAANPQPTKPGQVTLVALDASSVVTANTPVTALLAGHRTAGGWICNPTTAPSGASLGINEIGTASGSTSSGSTTFIAPGQTYTLSPSANAVSVTSTQNNHVFSGYGWQ